jgi:hypothetical protein
MTAEEIIDPDKKNLNMKLLSLENIPAKNKIIEGLSNSIG